MKFALVGDVMLGRLVNEFLNSAPPAYPWGDTLPIFRQADWRFCNLECVISDRGRPWSATPKVFHFRSDAKNLAVLEVAKITAVSLANNHALDFEYDAMFEMFGILDKARIARAGAGRDIEEAIQPAVCEVAGKKIGTVAFTDNEPAWEAKKDQPGIFYVPVDLSNSRAKALLEIIRQTKTKVDFLIVSAHWGPNWGYEPPAEQIPFARALLDAGADLIFGHSGHVFRGIEIYQGKPIIYCAGDFIDDYAVDEVERNDESFIFVLETEGGKIQKLQLYPTIIAEFQARLAKSTKAEVIAGKMQKLCEGFATQAVWEQEEACLEIRI